jgi:primosomal protein N' (replication factor Y)
MYAKVIIDILHSEVDRVFEYAVPEGMSPEVGFRVRVPFGRGNALREGYVIALSGSCEYQGAQIKSIHSVISDFAALTPGQLKLAHIMRRYYHTTLATALRLMFPAEMRGGRVRDRFQKEIVLKLTGNDYARFVASLFTLGGKAKAPKQMAVLEALHQNGRMMAAALEKACPGSASAVAALIKKGAVALRSVETLRSPHRVPQKEEEDFILTSEQTAVAQAVTDATGKYLLHGVTGSGKTEVYITIVRNCLARGQSAIVLVPEISLTPQLVAMFQRRIGQDIAVYHSTLTAGERYDEWKRMATGRTKVVIGARSAVFAPLRDIGVIIIDEEHETSYKSDMHPKYTAHEVARMRANIENASLLLASATPSVESYIKAKNGIYTLLEMPSRLFGLQLPAVEIVDMRSEVISGNRTIFSGLMYNEISKALERNRQVMLFINRRGYSTFVMCRGCGYVEYCDSCEVTMTYHSSRHSLLCHYCGRTRQLKETCPSCGRPYLKQYGIGTQQVEAHMKECFPQARVLRMDLDTTRGKDAHLHIYEQFKNHEADVLIGTQMIAKGLDFARVSLVGVVAADSSLYIPDYRSPEKTFQLLEQVSGRAGRKDPGKVVVQTFSPEHYAVDMARRHDFSGFFEEEMRLRKAALLPPYSVFFRIVFAGKDEKQVREACMDFEKGLRQVFSDDMEGILLLDAGEAPVRKIKGSCRWQILIKVLNDDRLAQFRKKLYIYTDTKHYKDCAFGMEINPQSMI